MGFSKLLRTIYIKTTNLTGGYHDDKKRLVSLYKLWSAVYDISVRLDPAYFKHLKNMIDMAVGPGEDVLDIGCGTGLGTVYSSKTAKTVTGVDISRDMIAKLKKKMIRSDIKNVTLIEGSYPECVNGSFGTVISSFTLVHFSKKRRPHIYKSIFENLKPGGKLGLFSARGEIAPAFETKQETLDNLKTNGFENITVRDVADIYRIVIAER